MKLKNFWAAALAMLALTACNKDQDIAPILEQPETKEVYATISVGQEDGIRAIYNINTNDDSGSISGLEMAEKNVKLRLAVKRGDGAPTYQDVIFEKTPNQNHAFYKGKILIPATGTGTYKLSAILLGEDGGKEFAKVVNKGTQLDVVEPILDPLQLEQPIGNKTEVNVPYVAGWTDISLAEDNALNPISLKFEPQGTLLRFRIKNTTVSAQRITTVRFKTSAFTRKGWFSFVKPNSGTLTNIHFVRDDYYPPFDYTLPNPTTIQAASGSAPELSPWFYIWVMPTESYKMETEVDLINANGDVIANVFSTNQLLPTGSVPMTLTIGGNHNASFDNIGEVPYEWGVTPAVPKLSIEYMADYDVNKTGDGFVKNLNTSDPERGYYTWDEAVAKFKTPITIEAHSYSMPTASEMNSVLPFRDYITAVPTSYGNLIHYGAVTTYDDVLEQDIKIGNVTKNYRADYRNMGNGVTYAVRFKDNTNYNRTAFRYSRINIAGQRHLKIEARYLGNKRDITIAQVASEEFWKSNTADIKTARLSFCGRYDDGNLNEPQLRDRAGYWHGVTEHDPYGVYSMRSFMNDASGAITYKTHSFSIRLWKRN
ncbi:MAG: hypothetical protein Q4A61_04975 [Porphyromonadaceae bacterium]|nr:hypothetical protein [Porphyromonadaceae bacterium]